MIIKNKIKINNRTKKLTKLQTRRPNNKNKKWIKKKK